MERLPLRSVLLALPLVLLTGCPDRNLVRPADPNAAAARGSESVYVIEAKGHPLVVDWQPEHRGDLEVAMREGVAVVTYDAGGLRLLKDCRIDGNYGFIGVNTKEQIVRLESADEVKANLPAAGLGILANVGGELGRSQQLDVAIVMVGKKKTTWATASKKDLKGSCQGATHFVRGATIGAFAMRTGAKGRARTVAELFGSGVAADLSRSKSVESVDGALDACRKASPEAEGPPSQCGALIRLELVRLGERSAQHAQAAAAATPQATLEAEACPQGFVFSEGKCTKPEAATTHVCKLGDVRDCSVQCEKGNAQSCDALGIMFALGQGVSQSHDEAAKLFAKACEAGWANACFNLGVGFENGRGVPKDGAKAVKLYAMACGEGLAIGCASAGRSILWGLGVQKDPTTGVKLLQMGCNGGDESACSDLGVMVLGGVGGLTKDDKVAAGLFKRACDGNVAIGCTNYAYMFEFGRGVPKSAPVAAEIYDKVCDFDPSTCVWRGVMLMAGLGGRKKDAKQAGAEFQKACNKAQQTGAAGTSGELLGCILTNELYGAKNRLDSQMADAAAQTWSETCKAGTARDCTQLGLVALAAGQKAQAKQLVSHGCTTGDPWACELAKHAALK